jgi:transcriptional regulator with AAA-type ATPase domain
MFKNMFKRVLRGPELPSRLEDLAEFCFQRYCLEQHVRLKALMEMIERIVILRVLEATHGNQRLAAKVLGVKPNTFHYMIRRMGIVPDRKFELLGDLTSLTAAPKASRDSGHKSLHAKPVEH